MPVHPTSLRVAVAAFLALAVPATGAARADDASAGLQWRAVDAELQQQELEEQLRHAAPERREELVRRLEAMRERVRAAAAPGIPVPREAVQVFTYEGTPRSVRVGPAGIAVDYGPSGVLFDPATGAFRRRFTVLDGFPEQRPEAFGPRAPAWRRHQLVGPGVACQWDADAPPLVAVATAAYGGRAWRALQPPRFLNELGRGLDWQVRRQQWGAWTPILRALSEQCYVEAAAGPGQPAQRFTTTEGLAGNIVTHLAVADGAIFAACVDIYDPDRKDWGPGGLCRFDARAGRWQRIDRIDGRPVRWVTLLQAEGDALWVGFREGAGVAGDEVVYGMGLYPGWYRPKTTAVVLARLKDGKWTSFARPPLPLDGRHPFNATAPAPAPTETPRTLVRDGPRILLHSACQVHEGGGNWDVPQGTALSLLDLSGAAPAWRAFDPVKDFDADRLHDLIAQGGQILVTSTRGLHRWDGARQAWQFLDPGAVLRNPQLSAVTPVGDEIWVGYTNQAFGVVGAQGISRYDERMGKWSYLSPAELGTASPVRSLVALPAAEGQAAEAWVHFAPRPWLGAAMEWTFYPRESVPRPVGIGRYADGKWQFPLTLEGVPASREVSYTDDAGKPRTATVAIPVAALAAAGGKLFVGTTTGVYQGPGPWREIAKGHVHALYAADDGTKLRVLRTRPGAPEHDSAALERGTYDPAAGAWAFEKPKETDALWREREDAFLHHRDGERWAGDWTLVPTAKPGKWAIGPLGTGEGRRRVILGPHAVWLASPGELIRLDRRQLVEWLGPAR